MANNKFDQSFADDMNDSYMVENAMGLGFGAVIDHLCDQKVSRAGLFESEEEKKEKNKMRKILNGDENYDADDTVERAELHGEDYDDLLDDGDIIDSVMGDSI